ncbi:hypothetical protein [Actinopolymorpha pittospori]|uniref:Uncharacterized protein n=1 Tax=Actinopolymorpha pittospori TaxID=648752 RepID=A0A927N722_9ACTN|nr:hypothetical protein [Actinopolymorpha pittospori]MBE1609670.1 hypothetical protein [Actinopolymorpha pittospori]
MSTITRRGISALGAGVLAVTVAVLPATPASAAGGLDPSYGTNGTAAVRITEWGLSPGWILPGWNDGAIVVGGDTKYLGGDPYDVETLGVATLASLTSTGAMDRSFNSGAVRAIDPEMGYVMDPGTTVVGAAVDPRNGSPLVATQHITRPGRITKLGRTSGQEWSVETADVGAIAVLADGRVRYCATRVGSGTVQSFVGGLTADGEPDPAVGANGLRPLPAIFGFCKAMAVTPTGALVLASSTDNARSRIIVARTNATSGVVDTTFGKGGTQVIGAVNRDYKVSRVAIGADGAVFLLGQFTDLNPDGSGGEARVALHKLGPDGTGMPGFGSGGLIRYGVGYFVPGALTIAPAGKVVVSINNGSTGSAKGILYRVTGATGAPDPAFGTGGRVIPPGPVVDARITSSGKLLTLGVKGGAADYQTVLQRRYG